jgi:beta-glucosidase
MGTVQRLGYFLAAALAATNVLGRSQPAYQDVTVPVEQRVEDLLGRMSLEEKLAQITTVWNRKREILTPSNDFDPARARQVFPAGIGHIARPSDLHGAGDDPLLQPFRTAAQTVALVNSIQHYAMKDTDSPRAARTSPRRAYRNGR